MSQKPKDLIIGIFGLILVITLAVLLVYGVYQAISFMMRFITTVDSDIAVAIIAAAATILISTISIILGRVYESRNQIIKEHRENKIPVYESLLEFLFNVLMGEKVGKKPTEQDIAEFASTFTQRIMVWGADDVLIAWSKWRRFSTNEEEMKNNPFEVMFLLEDLIKVIRKDLGHKNKSIEKGDLLALFINDIHSYLPKK